MPQADQAMGNMKTSTIALGAALGTIGAQALTRATGLVKQFAMQGIQAAKDYEQTVISIEGIFQGMGMSVEEATTKTKDYLSDLRDFAAKTPFELPQTLDAVKRLLSIGYAAEEVKDTLLPAIGDIVSALGQPPQSISAVVYAFGQMKSAGRVMSQDLMQIGNALPGFNAKVALAEQLFSGDMAAMAKATESGALDAETAIQAIIKAMQEFPGAAGAMARQSETLGGVISTFNDTVNNALIDGLMPSMPLLSQALLGVMPAVEAMAEGFAQQLGPALIQGAELMQQIVPVASALIPPIFELVDIFTGMAEILGMLAGPIVTLADGLGSLIDLFNALPGPVKTAVAVLTTLWLLSKRYSAGWMAANASVLASFATLRAGATVTSTHLAASMMSPRIAMEVLGITAKKVGVGVVASFRAMGIAAKGFMASLGPIGWALTAAAVAFEVFSGKSAEAEALVAELKTTVDETTGSLTALSAQMMGQQFRMDLSKEDQAALAQMGISVDDWVGAIMNGGPAVDAMRAKIQAVVDSNSLLGVSYNSTGDLAVTALRNFEGMADAAGLLADEQVAAAEATANAEYVAAQQSMAANRERSAGYREAAAAARAGAEETYAATSGLAYAHRDYADAAVRSQSLVTTAMQATEAATRALQTAFDELNGVINKSAAQDRMKASLDAMKESFDSADASVSDNRQSIRQYMTDAMAFAETLDDPVQQLDVMEGALKKVEGQMKAGAVDPKTTKLYKDMKGAVDAAKDEVANMDTAVANAEAAGLDVTNAIAKGIAAGMSEQESAINAAGLVGGETLIDGMNAGAGVSSPSTFAITAGRMVGVGMVQGLVQTSGQVRNTGQVVGNALVQGMIVSLNNGQGPVAAAARQVVEAAIAAAKAAGEIKSPSRVFMEIGDDLIKGLRLGWLKGADGFVNDIARTLQDAFWSMKDSRDAVVDAQKALKDIREERSKGEASARDVAAAERDLARAYRDAADARKALAEAERNAAAVRKLARRTYKVDIGSFIEFDTTDMDNLQIAQKIVDNIDTALNDARYQLIQRARRAGMTREAAEAYAESVMSSFSDALERKQRALQKAMEQLAEVRERIRRLEDQAGERREAGQSIARFIEDRFGQPSEFNKAYDAAKIGIDQAIDLFDRFEELITRRYTGLETAEDDQMIAALRQQTQKLIGLIKERDDINERLQASRTKLAELETQMKDAQKKITESIQSFFKPSGKISSADEFITGLQQRVAATRKFIADIATLRKRGVAAGTIEQILEMGVEQGGSFAATLAGASEAQIKEINTLTATSEDLAQKFGANQAQIMYGAGVASQQALVTGIETEYDKKQKEIQTVVDSIKALFSGLTDSNLVAGEAAAQALLDGLKTKEEEILTYIRGLATQIATMLQTAMSQTPTAPPKDDKKKNRRSALDTFTSVPTTTPTTVGPALQVAAGGIQVSVNMGGEQSSAVTQEAVRSAVMDALNQVAMTAQNARK
jgi:DNA-binding transcriptional MerR regulator